jgi:hypothetical protein
MVEPDKSQTTVRRIRFVCWMAEVTRARALTQNAVGQCNTYFFSTAAMVTRTRLSVTLCVYCSSFYFFDLL